MALHTLLSSTDPFLKFIIYDTISASTSHAFSNFHTPTNDYNNNVLLETTSSAASLKPQSHQKSQVKMQKTGKKRKRRKARAKEEAESQRMTHITVERNRRKQMNLLLSVLRSLMPQSYVQRGDQASIVGGAIEYVKELEQLLQSLEAQKLQLLRQQQDAITNDSYELVSTVPPFSQFFINPQYTWSRMPNKYASTVADIEVTLIETHASIRILSKRTTPSHLTHLISGFQSLFLTILHINLTTLHPLVLYSVSAKVEEQCQLTCVEDIATAVHHLLRIIEEGAALT